MPGTAVVQSGNYSLLIDTGLIVDGFTLDDNVKGILNNTEYVLDGTTQFADVTDGTLTLPLNAAGATWATNLAQAQCHLR